jgi:hypothetical protein
VPPVQHIQHHERLQTGVFDQQNGLEQLCSTMGFSLEPGAGNAKRIEVEDGS